MLQPWVCLGLGCHILLSLLQCHLQCYLQCHLLLLGSLLQCLLLCHLLLHWLLVSRQQRTTFVVAYPVAVAVARVSINGDLQLRTHGVEKKSKQKASFHHFLSTLPMASLTLSQALSSPLWLDTHHASDRIDPMRAMGRAQREHLNALRTTHRYA